MGGGNNGGMESEPPLEKYTPEQKLRMEANERIGDFYHLGRMLVEGGGDDEIIEMIAKSEDEKERARALEFTMKRIEFLSMSGDKKDLAKAHEIGTKYRSRFFGS